MIGSRNHWGWTVWSGQDKPLHPEGPKCRERKEHVRQPPSQEMGQGGPMVGHGNAETSPLLGSPPSCLITLQDILLRPASLLPSAVLREVNSLPSRVQ